MRRRPLPGHRMGRRAAEALVFFLMLGCGGPDRAPDDAGGGYPGKWRLEFALDSTREPGRGPGAWAPARDTSARARGTVTIRDSRLDPEDTPLAADYALDFTPLLGRQIACLLSDTGGINLEDDGDSVALWFTAGVSDCGFSGQARRVGDTLAGTWEEKSLGGPVARGRFRMWRQSTDGR